jgi:nucleoside-diphosphate-sugar epimerase
MQCFMTGATGALGVPTVRALVAAGHDVRGVARNDSKAEQLRAAGAEPVVVDVFDRDGLVAAVEGSDAILHLATNVPPLAKAGLPPAWKTHNRLRTETTRHLIDAARVHGVSRLVKESVTFAYPDSGDAWIDESVPVDEAIKMLQPTIEGERLVEAYDGVDGVGVVLRFGLFYGPHARSVDEALRTARLRRFPWPGPEAAYLSSVHLDDVATAVVAALGAPGGLYNVVDDDPVTKREYVDAFAAAFGLPRLKLLPARTVRTVSGSRGRMFTASQRVSNRKFRDASGWAPAYPSVREGWAAIGAQRASERQAAHDEPAHDEPAHHEPAHHEPAHDEPAHDEEVTK